MPWDDLDDEEAPRRPSGDPISEAPGLRLDGGPDDTHPSQPAGRRSGLRAGLALLAAMVIPLIALFLLFQLAARMS